MNALEPVQTTRDPALRALPERGLVQARAREAARPGHVPDGRPAAVRVRRAEDLLNPLGDG